MFKVLEPTKHILFMDVKGQVVIGFDNFCGKSDRVFDVKLSDLARNTALLQALKLESMYADTHKAIGFFTAYLHAFYLDDGVLEKLEENPVLSILIQDEDKLKKVREILG